MQTTAPKSRILRFFNGPHANVVIAGVVGLAMAVSGYLLITTKAAGYFAASEPDGGTLSGNASTVSDVTASGGKALQFNAPPTSGGGGDSGGGSTTSCPLPKYPDATCTGVPAGIALIVVNGDMTISTANTTISGKDIRGCVEVTAPGVIIKNSKITCTHATPDVVSSADGAYSGTPLTVQDSEISCGNTSGTAVGDTNIVTYRLNIHSCENGYDIDANVDVEDNYIHDLYNSAESHTDGIQFASGHYVSATNHSIVTGVLGVTINHNTILSRGSNGTDTTSAIISNRGGDTNVLIQSNLLAGGAFTLYCEQSATGSNYRVLNNHFSTIYHPTVGAYGPSTDCSDETQSGNVYHESGQALHLD
jgi:hypothetical protein